MRTGYVRDHDDGFTLVEIMSVVIIIGILVAIAIASYTTSIANAARVVCLDNQRKFEEAVHVHEADRDTTPTALADLSDYVSQYDSAHTCPADGRLLEFDPDDLTVTCTYPGHQR